MLTGYVAVILAGAVGMAGRALVIDLDRTSKECRCRLAAVAAHVGARTVGIIYSRTALCIVYTQELHGDKSEKVIRRPCSCTIMTGIA